MAKVNRDRKMQEVRDIVVDELPDICRDMIKLARNPKTPATARVQLISTLFRAAGLFGTDEGAREKEPHEMTPKELATAVATAKARAEALQLQGADDDQETDDDDGIMA